MFDLTPDPNVATALDEMPVPGPSVTAVASRAPPGAAVKRRARSLARPYLTSSIGDRMHDFSILMQNCLQFSSCQAPDQPTTEPRYERLRVTLEGNLLMVAAAPPAGAIGNTLYARRTTVLDGATVFMILPRPPRTITDPNFFKAIGSVVVFDGPGPRRLKAVGIDTLTKDCRGWIFDAVETD